MAKKEEHEKEPNHERWLVSYADFITLLFAVFVTLYAMGQTDKKKVEQVLNSMRDSFGYTQSSLPSKGSVIESGNLNLIPTLKTATLVAKRGRSHGEEKDFKSTKTAIEAYLMKTGNQQKVSVNINSRGLVVSLKEAGFFPSGSAALRPGSLALLNDVAQSLSTYSNSIRVEGHTDNIPISSAEYRSNWELSSSRAITVLQYLVQQYDFEPQKISATGYGEFRPVADNGSAEGRGRNRRVDIVLLSEQTARAEPETYTPSVAARSGGEGTADAVK
ncbi:flagellar motor protein MotB [Geomonas sp. RF6]|uniref:OmpA/MotB family protein n=1 Tax=Geomonas sp. RF6 TaxID=2897342 RepID=UPI001E42A10E|nr:flagellar motor protein MotB [Geomonas sp. RF6]UFS72413.1 flagellar motor protein MotB [Geomonas sp. RF6]